MHPGIISILDIIQEEKLCLTLETNGLLCGQGVRFQKDSRT